MLEIEGFEEESVVDPRLLDLREIQKEKAQRSLYDFVKYGWRYADPAVFVDGWHLQAKCEHLQALLEGEIKHLLINEPPRHMKSMSCAVFAPAWSWIDMPAIQWLFASYAQHLSIRDSVKCRRIIESPWYQQNWADRFSLTSDQNTKIRFDNSEGGYRIATSVDGTLTGDGGNVIVIDDPHNVKEIDSDTKRYNVLEWWDKAMSTRLNDPQNDHYIIVCQRVHEADLSGHVLEGLDSDDWVHLMLPARFEEERKCFVEVTGWEDPRKEEGELLWPERITEGVLSKLEGRMGSLTAAGQLQQRPAPAGGGLFKRAWFEIVDELPKGGNRGRYWDLAATEEEKGKEPDWTVGGYGVFLDGVLYLADFRRNRWSPQKTEIAIGAVAGMDGRMLPVYMEQEPGSSGKIVIDHYARRILPGYIFYGDKKTGSKVEAARPLAAAAEAGNVKLVKGLWNNLFLNEIEVFPNGKFDDQVDVASGLHNKLAPGEPSGVVWV